jgi:type IV secretory pathway VirB3-like protein
VDTDRAIVNGAHKDMDLQVRYVAFHDHYYYYNHDMSRITSIIILIITTIIIIVITSILIYLLIYLFIYLLNIFLCLEPSVSLHRMLRTLQELPTARDALQGLILFYCNRSLVAPSTHSFTSGAYYKDDDDLILCIANRLKMGLSLRSAWHVAVRYVQ